MTFEATFRHGDPVMVDYTPTTGDVAAGQVVLLGSVTANTAGSGAVAAIAHHPIANNTLGALAAGGGVYDATSLQNSVAGSKVFWDDGNNKVTTTSTNNAQFGYVVESAGGGANTTTSVLHKPYP